MLYSPIFHIKQECTFDEEGVLLPRSEIGKEITLVTSSDFKFEPSTTTSMTTKTSIEELMKTTSTVSTTMRSKSIVKNYNSQMGFVTDFPKRITLNYPPNNLAKKISNFTCCPEKNKICLKSFHYRKRPKMCLNFFGSKCTNLPCSFKGCILRKLPSKICVKIKCIKNKDVVKLLRNEQFQKMFSRSYKKFTLNSIVT